MVRAVIFDFDGTIADTLEAIREGLNTTMRRRGYPEYSVEDVRTFINNGARELVRRALPADLQNDEALLTAVHREYLTDYRAVYLHTKTAYDGIPEAIAALHAAGYRIGVLSNKPHEYMDKLCRQVLLPGSCDLAQGALPDHPTKPDPYLPRLVADSLGVAPRDCVMVGDSDVDFLTAQNASMQHIGVAWGFRDEAFLRAHGVICIAHTPADLPMLIRTLDATEQKGS